MLAPKDVSRPVVADDRVEIENWFDSALKQGEFKIFKVHSGWRPASLDNVLSQYRQVGWLVTDMGA